MEKKINIENCQHVELSGLAFYDDENKFFFSPDESNPCTMVRFRRYGVAQQMADGTFDFVACKRRRCESVLLKKLAHGRLSATKDGAIQLTLKVRKDEGIDIRKAIIREAMEAMSKN